MVESPLYKKDGTGPLNGISIEGTIICYLFTIIYFNTSLEITIFCTSLVPSPIVHNLASL